VLRTTNHARLDSVADLDLVLRRDDDLEDEVLRVHGLDAVLEVGLDLVLVAGVRVDHVPGAAFLDRRILGRFLPAFGDVDIFDLDGCGFAFACHGLP
jgi:hypothetical protein